MNDKPVHTIILGPIKGAIWRNPKRGPKLTVTFQRLYKDKDDKWQSSTIYTAETALILTKVADQCALWMYQNSSTQ